MTANDMRALDCTGSGRHNRWVCSFKTGVNKTCGLSFKYERDLRLHKEQAAHARNRAAAADARRRGIAARAAVEEQQKSNAEYEVCGDDVEEGSEEKGENGGDDVAIGDGSGSEEDGEAGDGIDCGQGDEEKESEADGEAGQETDEEESETDEEKRKRIILSAVTTEGFDKEGVGYKWYSEALIGAFVVDDKDEFCRRCDEINSPQELESGAVRACACCTWVWHRECLLPPISATAVVPSDNMFACSFECVDEVPETFSLRTFSS
jgi:hypothetical protein